MKNSGFLVVNKPVGPTSHDIVNQLRKITGIKKIGHAGTLDPFAGGVLVLAIGRNATKQIDKIVKTQKKYKAQICLGVVTDTHDSTGKIIEENKIEFITRKKIKKVLKNFQGRQKQIPPMFSAKKIKGEKLYNLARQGKIVEREPVEIEVYELKLKNYDFPGVEIEIICSSGTYIRSLAYDIGQELECGAYLKELQRTAVGDYTLKNAVNPEILTSQNWTEYLITNT